MEADILAGEVRSLRRVLEDQFPGKLPDKILDTALLAAARAVARHAKRPGYRFTDRTGRTRRSIKARRERRGGRSGTRRGGGSGVAYTYAAVSIGGEGARQGALLEFGTSRMKARTPLRSAIEESAEAQREELRRVGQRELEKYVKEINSGQLRAATRRALAG